MTTVAVTPDAAAVADGLRKLAGLVEDGTVTVQQWGVEVLYNPGGPAQVRTVARRLGLKVHEGPGFCRATMRLSPKVAYVLYAQKVTTP